MQKKNIVLLSLTILFVMMSPVSGRIRQAGAVSSSVVISQVYGGGGNAGAVYRNDYIELFNIGVSPVNLSGWSIQYAAPTGAIWSKTDLSGVLQPGQYYLIQEAVGSGGSLSLPTPDAAGSINLSATSGKVALTSSAVLLSGACPAGTVDLVGFGTANCFEGTALSALSNTNAAKRDLGGCSETDVNSADFSIAAPTVEPTPRNTSSSFNPCSGSDTAPYIASVAPLKNAVDVAVDANINVTFSEAVTLADAWFTLSCSMSGTKSAAVSGGPLSYTIDPDVDFSAGETCALTVNAVSVSDVDANDPPDLMAADFNSSFTVIDPALTCGQSFTPIYNIQGSGDTAAITGVVTVEGIVVSDDEGPAPSLGGFYLQDISGDGNSLTSDGIFVFNGAANNVNNGDIVRVTGTAAEYQGETQINTVTSIVGCGSGTLTPTDISLPFASSTVKEQYEGMLVRIPQTLYVTEHYLLGRFGEVTLSANGRLAQPTAVELPGVAAATLQAANDLNRIILDDASNAQYPDPILFARGGNPLSAGNTLRGGDTVANLIGVMTYGWGGNISSPNAYRIRTIHALGGGIPNFEAADPRPSASPNVGGSLKAVGMNLLNYFNTFGAGSCLNGLTGSVADCRGADDAVEFARQSDKTVSAILEMNADVLGVIEIENDGYGPASAIQDLVNKLNAVAGADTYAFIDVDARTGQVDALGNDAIKVGIIYKAARVLPVGTTAVLNTAAFINGGDGFARNRASLLQAFQTNDGERFLFNVNHLKSKGSVCDAPDAGDGQGNCSAVRTNAVNELLNWYLTDPTGMNDPDLLIVGDLNSYAKEDPIAAFESDGYVNMVAHFNGADAYSYVFDGQWGYLDHALASPSLLAQTSGVADWHINAGEPAVLDYNVDSKSVSQITSLYNNDPFRMSDHDPLLVGLQLDSIAPDTQIDSHPSAQSGDAAEFTFSSSETNSVFECKLDASPFSACASPSSFSGLNEGPHTFQVRATDWIGNVEATPASFSWTVELAAPTVISIARSGYSPTNAASLSFVVTFSEPVSGVDKFDFALTATGALSNAAVTSVSGTGTKRNVTLNTGSGSGTLRLDLLDNDSIKDAAKKSLGGGGAANGDYSAGEIYTVDKTPPSVASIVRASADNTSASRLNFFVTFSKPVFGVDRFDFDVVSTGTLTGASIISVSGGYGSTRVVAIELGSGSGTLGLNLIDNDTIHDDVRNTLGGAGLVNGDYSSGEIFTIDRTPPSVVSISQIGANPTSAGRVNFVVTFSEPVTGVDRYDFNLIPSGFVTNASIVSVTGTGSIRIVSVTTGTGAGTLQLNLVDNDTILDAKRNRLGGTGVFNGNFSGQICILER